MVKLIRISEEAHREAKMAAARMGLSLEDFASWALTSHARMATHPNGKKRAEVRYRLPRATASGRR